MIGMFCQSLRASDLILMLSKPSSTLGKLGLRLLRCLGNRGSLGVMRDSGRLIRPMNQTGVFATIITQELATSRGQPRIPHNVLGI
jgi:hypothetical protein